MERKRRWEEDYETAHEKEDEEKEEETLLSDIV